MEARPPAQNRHGGAPRGARPSDFEGRGVLASAPARRVTQALRACVTRRANRVPLHPGACRRSAHPSIGVGKFQDPGANAPRERDGCGDWAV